MNVFDAVLPVALVTLAGYVCVLSGLVKRPAWDGIEVLSFRVLIPATLVQAIAGADLSPGAAAPMVLALCLAIFGGGALVLATVRLAGPSRSTLFQVTTRWNAFIALALAEQTGNPQVSGLIAVSIAAMIPVINVVNVVTIAALCGGSLRPGAILRQIALNPLVIGSVLGIALNLSGATPAGPAAAALDFVARAALGIGLMCIGAAISARRLMVLRGATVLGVGLRLAVVPLLFLAAARLLGLDGDAVVAGVLVTAVPTAANGYVLARAMGGDAELYADILTWQTVAALMTLPLLLALATALPRPALASLSPEVTE
jgi:malonate transporter